MPEAILIVSSDPALVRRLQALVDAVGLASAVELSIAVPEAALLGDRLVLLGLDALAQVPGAQIPGGRWRARLVVVTDREMTIEGWSDAVRVGVVRVAVLPEDEGWLLEYLSAEVMPGVRAATIAVIPGHGGAGASTLAIGLAVEAARQGAITVLLDADPVAGGLDLGLGLETRSGVRWDDLLAVAPRARRTLRIGELPAEEGVNVLTFARSGSTDPLLPTTAGSTLGPISDALRSLRCAADVLVCDLSRGFGVLDEAILSLAQLTVVVARPQIRAVAAADQILQQVRRRCARVALVARGRPERRTAAHLASLMDAELLGISPDEPEVAAAIDHGLPLPRRSGQQRICRAILSRATTAAGGTS